MGGKSGGGARTPIEAPNTLHSAQSLRIVDAISEGVIEGFANGNDAPFKSVYFNDTPVQNADGSYNFKGVIAYFLNGTPDQPYVPDFDSTERTVAVSASVKRNTPIVRAVTDSLVSRLRVTVGVERNVAVQDNGDSLAAQTHMVVELVNAQGVQASQSVAFTEKGSSAFHYDVLFDKLPAAPFNIRVVRVTPDSTTDKVSNNTFFASYVEIIDAKLSYPHTALAALKVDSDQFGSQVPRRNYLLKGKLIKIPSNYDPITRQYTGATWDGSFKTAWSNNPAWVFYDILTQPRYSTLARRLNVADVDKWSLYAVGRYCDELVPDGFGGQEPRFVCNAYLTTKRQVSELLMDLASVFTGLPIWNGNQVSVVLDSNSDPVALYTNSNVVDGQFTYSGAAYKAIHTAVEVQYLDKYDGYRNKIELVKDDEAIQRYGHNVKRVTAFGCDSRGQAARFGAWVLQTELRQQNMVSFTVGREGLKHLPHDIVQVMDNDYAGAELSGRVVAVNNGLITLDRTVKNAVGAWLMFTVFERQSDGGSVAKLHKIKIMAQPQADQVRLETAAQLVVGDTWIVSGQVKPRLYRAIGITENSDEGTYTISALLHDPRKYTAVDSWAKFEREITTLHNITPQLVGGNVAADNGAVVLTWDSLTTSGDILSYEIKIYRNNKLYRELTQDTPEIRLFNLPDGHYQAEIRGRNARGSLSAPLVKAWSINYTITGLRTTPKTMAIALDWVLPAIVVSDVVSEVWYGKSQDSSQAQLLAKLPYPQNSYLLTGVAVTDTFYFWVRLVDRRGNSGQFTAAVVGQADPDPAPIVAQIQGAITQSTLSQALINQLKADDLAAENRAKADAATKITAEANTRATAIHMESVARTAAVNAAADTAAQNLRAEVGKLNTAIATAANQAQVNLTTKENELIANATALGNRVTSVENVNAQQAVAIQTVSAAQNATASALEVEKKARADGDKAEAAQRATLATQVSQNAAAIATEIQARTNAQAAETQAREALEARVATAESGLIAERKARADADTAQNSALTAATARINTAESSIGTLQQGLVTQQQALAQSTQILAAKIDGLNIGGTNLLFDSEFSNSLNWVVERSRHEKMLLGSGRTVIKVTLTAQTGPVGVHHAVISRKSSIKAGETYTLSFIARASQYISLNYIYLMRVESGGNQFIGRVGVNENWQRCKLTFTANWDSDQAYLLIGSDSNYVENQWFEFHSVKLEYGNVATDWSPTPADLDKRDTETLAELTVFKEAQAIKDAAQTHEINAAKSQIGTTNSAIEQIRSTKADKTEVATLARTMLQSEWRSYTDTAKSEAATDAQAKADAAKTAAIAEAKRLNTATDAKITTLQQTVSNDRQAAATRHDNLSAKLDNLGAVNLLVDSDFAHSEAWGSVSRHSKSQYHGRTLVRVDITQAVAGQAGVTHAAVSCVTRIEQGQTYTLSLNVQGTAEIVAAGLNYLYLMRADGTNQRLPTATITASLSNRVSVTFTAQWSSQQAYLLVAVTGTFAVWQWFAYHSVKLERGSVATDWSPTPVDIDNAVAGVQAALDSHKSAQATADAAQTAEINTAKSQINTHKSAIDGIKSTKADKTEVASLARTTLQSEWQTAAANAANAAKSEAATDAQAKADAAKTAAIAEAKRLNTATDAKITTLQQTVSNDRQAAATRHDNLSAKLDNLGAVNLLVDSDFAHSEAWGSVSRHSKSQYHGRTLVRVDITQAVAGQAGVTHAAVSCVTRIEQGQTYTLSLNVQGTAEIVAAGLNYLYLMRADGTNQRLPTATITASLSNRVSVTFTAQWSSQQAYLLVAVTGTFAVWQWFAYHSVKLERGSVATDWSPTPVDIDNAVAGVQAALDSHKSAQATADAAQTAEINTAKSQINTHKSAIDGIKSTKADKTEVASLARTTLQSEWQTAAANAANAAKSEAATDAQAKADAAKQAAITAAATAAQTKADAAKAAAIATASGDASSKADAAKADAIADAAAKDAVIKQQAATDAQTKADAAKAAAIAEANRLNTATQANVTALQQAVTTQNQATASQITNLTSKIGVAEANIQTVQTATTTLDGKVQALHTVKTEVVASGKKVVAGIALGVDGATGETQFNVHAQKFAVWDGTMLKPVFAVVTQNGKTQTAISGDLIADGTIHGKHIAASQTIQSPVINAGTINGTTVNSGVFNGGSINIGNGNFVVDGGGNLTAKSGRFEGTVYANKIEGDILKSYQFTDTGSQYELSIPPLPMTALLTFTSLSVTDNPPSTVRSAPEGKRIEIFLNGNRVFSRNIQAQRIGQTGDGSGWYDVFIAVTQNLTPSIWLPAHVHYSVVVRIRPSTGNDVRKTNYPIVCFVGRA